MRDLLARDEAAAALLPVLGRPEFTDGEVLGVLDRGWPKFTQPQRMTAIEILFGRSATLDQADPPEQAIDLIRRARDRPFPAVPSGRCRGSTACPASGPGGMHPGCCSA